MQVHVGKPIDPNSAARPRQIATASHSAVGKTARCTPGAAPVVRVERRDGIIVALNISCGCGETITLQCQYTEAEE
ncbi:MAG: hypothetical protein VXZ82_20810 [Planctomycetota bacterium]|nr:hypothetical protein [Planctomycetota bacterium]